jgi:hypothetical protein
MVQAAVPLIRKAGLSARRLLQDVGHIAVNAARVGGGDEGFKKAAAGEHVLHRCCTASLEVVVAPARGAEQVDQLNIRLRAYASKCKLRMQA